ncbi:MAG: rhomboid family intramembrane serine protease [Planctomycetota bacterium]
MIIPLKTDRPLRQTPVANIGLIVVIAVMFVVQTAAPAVESALLLRPMEPSLFGFVGSGFLHGGPLHLLGNVLFLYIFGNNINDRLGNTTYVLFFLGGVVFAGIMHSLLEDNPALGASGGVSAVTGLFLALFPKTRVNLLFFFFIITAFSVPSIWFIGIYFVIDVVQGFDTLLLGNDKGVANWAHVGGGIYGFLVGLVLLKFQLLKPDRGDVLAMWKRRRDKASYAKELRASGQTHGSAMDVVPRSAADPKAMQAQELKAELREALDRGDASSAAALYERLVAVDDRQVLPPREQLTVAETLYREARHAGAATAFDAYLARYARPGDAEAAQARLMLGLLQSRYLNHPHAASTLTKAAEELDAIGDAEHADFARAELARVT